MLSGGDLGVKRLYWTGRERARRVLSYLGHPYWGHPRRRHATCDLDVDFDVDFDVNGDVDVISLR
jgi:hypothetical protein